MAYIICPFVPNSYSSNKDDSWIVEIISLGIHSWLSQFGDPSFLFTCVLWSLVCCDSGGYKESDTTERLNWTMCTSIIGFMPLLLFSHQVVSDSSRFHGLKYARLPYTSPSPRVFPSSCPLNWQCYIPKLVSIKSVMPSSYLILCHSLYLLPSVFPSIRVFSNEPAVHISSPKYKIATVTCLFL